MVHAGPAAAFSILENESQSTRRPTGIADIKQIQGQVKGFLKIRIFNDFQDTF